jgi:hypothetical protein
VAWQLLQQQRETIAPDHRPAVTSSPIQPFFSTRMVKHGVRLAAGGRRTRDLRPT